MTKNQQDTLKTIAQLLALVVLVGGVAFAAGNYPTRGEWEADRQKTLEEIDELKSSAEDVRLEQVRLRSSLTAIKESQVRNEGTTTEIRKKLDTVLEGGAGDRGRRR